MKSRIVTLVCREPKCGRLFSIDFDKIRGLVPAGVKDPNENEAENDCPECGSKNTMLWNGFFEVAQ